MRNLKIGLRILFSFAIVLFLVVILTVVVGLASFNVVRNANAVAANNMFSIASNNMLNSFNEARAAANVFFTLSNPTKYQEANASITKAQEYIAEQKELIAAYPKELGSFAAGVDAIEQSVNNYHAMLADVNQKRETQVEMLQLLNGNSESSRSLYVENYRIVYERLFDNAKWQEDIILGKQAGQLYSLVESLSPINTLRTLDNQFIAIDKSTQALLYINDLSTYDAIINNITSYEADLAARVKTEPNVTLRIIMKNATDIIANYKEALIAYHDATVSSAQSIENANNSQGVVLHNTLELTTTLDAVSQQLAAVSTRNSLATFWIMIFGALAAIITGLILALYLTRGITRPINQIVKVADRLSLGDVELTLDTSARDEIGKLSHHLQQMIDSIKEQSILLKHLSDGDFSVTANVRSDSDVMGKSLVTLIYKMNHVFADIRDTCDNVNTESAQMAIGSQSLARGSQQQSSAVEQLSSSISEVAAQTDSNASLALAANDLAIRIKANAERSSMQMNQMMTAVKEIRDASQSIGKVIKVIDDIAFQTNILALNAAVEAARAGQHGKGFAVVAEEVRNLATKSANAAKDTSGLIADSMEKAALGERIAVETATSLGDIVTGINESSRVVADIAKASTHQSDSIKKINKGIEQVSHVVQTNSATSEESAAASQQLSQQAGALTAIIGRFTLTHRIATKERMQALVDSGLIEYNMLSFGDSTDSLPMLPPPRIPD